MSKFKKKPYWISANSDLNRKILDDSFSHLSNSFPLPQVITVLSSSEPFEDMWKDETEWQCPSCKGDDVAFADHYACLSCGYTWVFRDGTDKENKDV